MIAVMLKGQNVLPLQVSFDIVIMMIRLRLPIVYGLIVDEIMRRMGGSSALLIGSTFGMAIYFITFYPNLSVVFSLIC